MGLFIDYTEFFMKKILLIFAAVMFLILYLPADEERELWTLNNHHYSLFKEMVSWHQAKKKCEEMGGYLVCIESEDENNFLYDRIKDIDGSIFIGASDEGKEGDWIWVNGKGMSYTNWAKGEPDNAGDNEHYACFIPLMNEDKWSDMSSVIRRARNKERITYGYICEWNSEPPSNLGFRKSGSEHYGRNVPTSVSSKVLKSLIIVEGKKGKGSGFVVNMNGKKTLITNIHVLFDNNEIDFRDINNNKVNITNMYLSRERDIFMGELADGTDIPALEMEKDVSSVPLKTEIAVAGNSQGAGVNTVLGGSLSGIGAKTIETSSAAFVSGNSGSPIIIQKTGKVVGVATFVTYRGADWTNFDSPFVFKPRRFALRIDNIKKEELEPFELKKYYGDLKIYNNLLDACTVGYLLYRDFPQGISYTLSIIPAGEYEKYPEIKNIIVELNRKIEEFNKAQQVQQRKKEIGMRSNTAIFLSNMKRISKQIRGMLSSALKAADKKSFNYTYIANESGKYTELLDYLIKNFDRKLEQIDKTAEEHKKNTKEF